jgi:hypothetical protein
VPTTPADPRVHSPALKAVFHLIEGVLEAELHDLGLPHSAVEQVKRRAVNRLIWGDPRGYVDSESRFEMPEDLALTAGGLLGSEVVQELVGQGVLQGPADPGPQGPSSVPNERIVIVASTTEQAQTYHRAHVERLPANRVTYMLPHNAHIVARGLGGAGTEIIVLEYPNDKIEDLVKISAHLPGTKLVHANA